MLSIAASVWGFCAAAGTLALAWFMTKFTEPLRMAVSLMVVPPLANALEHSNNMKANNSEQQQQQQPPAEETAGRTNEESRKK